MPYTYTDGVDPTIPAGGDPANVDDDMRAIKLAYNERFDDILGTTWATDDPVLPTKYGPGVAISNKQAGSQAEFDNGNSGAAKTINWDNGNFQKITVDVNTTLTLSNGIVGSYLLKVVVGAVSRTITWAAPAKWPGGSATQPTTNRTTLYSIYCDGTSYFIGVFGANYTT